MHEVRKSARRRGSIVAAYAVGLGLLFGLAMGGAAARDDARTAELDAAFARYFAPEAHGLVVDLDLQASFAGDGGEVAYRTGPLEHGEFRLADPVQGATRLLVDEATLRAALSAAGAPAGAPRLVRYLPARQRLVLAVGDGGRAPDPFSGAALGDSRQWAYDLATGQASVQPREAPPRELVSPDGRSRLFVRDYNLWLRDEAGETALTKDGNYDRRYATNYPRFSQQAEAGSDLPPMRIEAEWSPDSRHVLTYRLDRNGARIHEGVQTQPPGGGPARTFNYVYPNAGEAQVPLLQPILVDASTRTVRDLDVPVLQMVFPVPPKLSWNNGRIFYEWASRGQGENTLFEVDPATGRGQVRVREALEPNVTAASTVIRPQPELGGTVLVSERSGWAQLYLVPDGSDPAGGRRLTEGDWEISALLHASPDGILVTGKGREPGENPYYDHLYRVGLDGSLLRLTPEPLNHEVEVSKDGQWFLDRMSSPSQPPLTVLRSTRDGRTALELGRADPSALLADGFRVPEVFQGLATDGKTPLYATIFRPRNFDPTHRYPVIEHIYTGPTRHRFRGDYAANIAGMQSALTQLGAIVVTIDAPGTLGRGRAFRMQAFRNLHAVGVDDHVGMLRQMQARYPSMDIDRGVGAIGGSSGGYDTFRFMVRRPDIYVAGVSQSGNHQLRMVKAWWPEMQMGLPDESVWAANSNATYADRLQGKLLLVHGDLDDNVPIGTTLTLAAALDKAGKPYELLVLPNVGHSVRTPEFHRAVRRFFLAELITREVPRATAPDAP
ncbi:MAG: DPP IV N-terminal domain-containing protein [Proteobacteria bacterium]|nr:DPP IV N-terminal domain-containing protein [Pseudomonadota bacterium]